MKNEENYTDVDYTNDSMSEEYEVINSEDVTIEDASDYVEETENFEETQESKLIEFQRIDWEKTDTITSYGADLLTEMGKIESNKNALSSGSESNRDKINELIAKIENFVDNMAKDIGYEEKNDKKKEQTKELVVLEDAIEKTSSHIKRIKKILKRNIIKLKTNGHTDSITEAEFNTFKDNLRELSSLIDIERENIEQEVQIYYEYLKMIAPYFATLEYLIKEGEKEAKAREDYINKKYGKRELDKFETYDYQFDLKTVKRLTDRLRRLQDQLFVFKTQIYEAKLTVDNDEEISILYKEYNDITVPSLESKGESMLNVKVQRERINTLIGLDNMTNNAYQTTSRVISANIEDVTTMKAEGQIKTETMKELVTNIQKGLNVINNAEKLTAKLESEKSKLRDELHKTINTDMLLENSVQTAYLVEETSSVQTDSQQVGKRRVRK